MTRRRGRLCDAFVPVCVRPLLDVERRRPPSHGGRSEKYTRLLGDGLYGSCYRGDGEAAREAMVVTGPRGNSPARTHTHRGRQAQFSRKGNLG